MHEELLDCWTKVLLLQKEVSLCASVTEQSSMFHDFFFQPDILHSQKCTNMFVLALDVT